MMRLITLFCGAALAGYSLLFAQVPGVTGQDWSAAQALLNSHYGPRAELEDLINVDRSMRSMKVADGHIEDPEGLLHGCYLMVGKVGGKGLLAVLRNNQMLWNSDTVMTDAAYGPYGSVDWVCNALRDHSVVIVVGWNTGGESKAYWFFRWDGVHGTVANALDSRSRSMIYSSWLFRFVDIRGDGFLEAQTTDNDSLVTHGWDGSAFGPWASVPQPTRWSFYPTNKFSGHIETKVSRIADSLYQYDYAITNDAASLQPISCAVFWCRVREGIQIRRPKDWIGYADALGYQWSPMADQVNSVLPGATQSGLTILSSGLPKILVCYTQGLNGDPVENADQDAVQEDLRTNSVIMRAVGPDSGMLSMPLPEMVDSLVGMVATSKDLGWIRSQSIADKYTTSLTSAKTAIEQGNYSVTSSTLHQILDDVRQDSSAYLSSEAYALLHFNSEYLLNHLPTHPTGLAVRLLNSVGTLLTTGTLQYYEGTWKAATSNGDGTFTVNTTQTTVSLRMTYAYGSQTKQNVPVSGGPVVFQTTNVSARLQDSFGNPLDTGTVQYYAGAWREFGTTSNGVARRISSPARTASA